MPEFVTSRDRDAWATVRGYVYQVDLTIIRWLALREDQQLQLERGEDIDTLSRQLDTVFRADANEQRRLLEQIKHRDSNITLRSEAAVEAIASFIEHRKNNPELSLSFLFTTNAAAGKERDARMPKKLPGIVAWDQVSTGVLNKPTERQVVAVIRGLLEKAACPTGLHPDTWNAYTIFVRNATADQFQDLIGTFQWSMSSTAAAHLDRQITEELVKHEYASNEEDAQAKYERLFLYVFKLLSQSGLKTLLKSELKPLFEQSIDAENKALLSGMATLLGQIQIRMSALEQGQVRIEQALAKLSRPSCWVIDDGFIDEARAEHSSGMASLYDRPGAARLRHIVANEDIRRKPTGRVLHAIDARKREPGMRFVLVRAKGGNGKTTFLWRLAYELALRRSLVLVAREGQSIDYDNLTDLCAEVATNSTSDRGRVYLILDNVYRNYALLLQYLDQRNIPNLTVIASSRLGDIDPSVATPGLPLLDVPEVELGGLDTNEALQLIGRMETTGALKVADALEIANVSLAQEEPVIVLVARLMGSERLETHVLERLIEMNNGRDPTITDASEWDQFLKIYFTIARYHAWGLAVPHTVLPDLTSLTAQRVNNLLCERGSDTPVPKAREYLQGGCASTESGWTTDHELIASSAVRLLSDGTEDPLEIFIRTLDQLAKLVADVRSRSGASSMAARLFRRITDTPTLLFPTGTEQSPLDTLLPINEEFIVLKKPSSPEHEKLADTLDDARLATALQMLLNWATLEEIVEQYAPGYIRVSRWEDALRLTEKGLSSSPTDQLMWARLLVLRGTVHEQLSENDLAVADYDDVLKDFPDQPEMLMARGRALAALGHYREAIESYNASLRVRRDDPDTLLNRGFAYHSLGEYDKALVDYETSLQVRPNDASALTSMGVTYTKLDKFDRALGAHNKALEADPQHARALSNRGITYYHRGMLHKAGGRQLEAQADFASSLKDLDKSLDLDSEDAETLTARGNTRSELGLTTEAMQDYKDALVVRPNAPIALHNLGFMRHLAGEHDQAEACFNASLAVRPNHAHTLANRGMNRNSLGRYADAVSDYEQALSVLNGERLSRENQGLLYKIHYHYGVTCYLQCTFELALDQFDAALEHFNIALEREMIGQQEDATLPLLAWRALSLEHVGRTEAAVVDLNRINALYRDEPFTSYAWACFHSLRGDNEAAFLSLSKATEGDIRFRKTAQTDADFETLKSNARFQALVFEY